MSKGYTVTQQQKEIQCYKLAWLVLRGLVDGSLYGFSGPSAAMDGRSRAPLDGFTACPEKP